jgi:stage V sporulation protein D (sporulation-specific penicillin-binding protein)
MVVAAAIALSSVAVMGRLVELQVVDADRLKAKALRQHQQVIEVGGRRGSILDRQGRELAVSVTTSSLYAHPQRVKDPERAARLLAPVLGRPVSEILGLLGSDEPFVWIARRLDPKVARAIYELNLPVGKGQAIDFQEEPKRFYPQGALAAHVVGFADPDQRGLEGIEHTFDEALSGDSTKFLAVRDARGAMLLQQLRPPAKRSEDVILTIDLVLQHIVERELDRAMDETGAKAASAILLDPKTGQVLAMANRPAVDPRSYGKSNSEARRNRAVAYLYEPGSTFKIVSASAALEHGTVTPEQRFNCASFTVAGKSYTDVHKYGVLSVREILEHSSNVGMVQVGRTVPREQLRGTIVDFGFGRRTGIELTGERSGDIPSIPHMSATSPAAMSIGYEVQASPLQVASAFATIANEGLRVPPRIVLGTRDEDGSVRLAEPPEPHRALSARTAVTMTNILEGVVLRGTGQTARVAGYHIAGKTGTAKKVIPGGLGYTTNEYYASFGGFGPLKDPAIAGFVLLDTPRGNFYYGGQVAAPVLGRILADAFDYLRIPPDDDPWKAREDELQARAEKEAKRRAEEAKRRKKSAPREGAGPEDPEDAALLATTPGEVPDLRGKTAREAVAALVSHGYRARIAGRGVVIAQNPPAGTAVSSGQTCTLSLGDGKEAR